MSDIRLRKITIDPNLSNLIIQNGTILITDTTPSNNAISGALVIDGGIGINSSIESISSTSGGGLTIKGGLGVAKNTYLGGNLTLDNNTKTFSVNGITNNRLFLDTISNKNFYLSLDGINKHFDITNTELNINVTKDSVNLSTASLIVHGGISINNTTNSLNASSGGALTVGGGVGILGDTYIDNSLVVGKPFSNEFGLFVNYTGYQQFVLENSDGNSNASFNMENNTLNFFNKNDYIFNTTLGNFTFNNTNNTLFVIRQNYSEFSKYLYISDTIQSLNVTTGSLILEGGISIKCSTDAVSATNGGSLTIKGGLALNKKLYTNDLIAIEITNGTKNNKLILHQSNQDVSQTHLFTGFGVNSSGSLRFQIPSLNDDFIFYSSNTSGITSNEILRVKGNKNIQIYGLNQSYSFVPGGASNNDLSLQGLSTATPSSFGLYTADGDRDDNIDLKIFNLGLPNNVTNSEYLKIGWNSSNLSYDISSNYTGTGQNNSINIYSSLNNQLLLNTTGNIILNSSVPSTDSSNGSLILMSGGISINSSVDSLSYTQGGSLTSAGGGSFRKNLYVGGTFLFSTHLRSNTSFATYSSSTSASRFAIICASTTGSKINNFLQVYSFGGPGSSTQGALNIGSTTSNYFIVNSNFGTTYPLEPISLGFNSSYYLTLMSNGNIGINNTNPQYNLDVNGTLNANNYSLINQLTIYNTSDAFNINSSGSLSVLGGTSISKSLYVGGSIYFTNTSDLSSSTAASVLVSGGITIRSTQISTSQNGALTVLGGVYIGENLYINGNINSNISTIGNIYINSTHESINISTGSIITNGGITIKCSTNSVNLSNGGSILTPGGISIGKDMYLGGNLYDYGITYYRTNNNNVIIIYDNFNFVSFSIDRNLTSSDFSISRYDSIGTFLEKSLIINRSQGIITLNNTINSSNLSTASLIVNGGVNINSSTNSTNLISGGALTIQGGTSIIKDTYIGGQLFIKNTTNSNNYSTGAVIVDGGVGIKGSLNVFGNSIFYGNLDILGTTTSIHTTNTVLTDNTILLNSAPTGTADAGVLTERYQTTNNSGLGDIVNDIEYTPFTLASQSGLTSTEIKLPTNASSSDNYYNNWWIRVTNGFSINQVRQIVSYIGSSKIATIDLAWNSQNPSSGDIVYLYNRNFVGFVWNETDKRIEFGYTVDNPQTDTINFINSIPIYASSAQFNSTVNASNLSTGSVILNGGLLINSTEDATSNSSGNSLSIAGGASIMKSLYVGNNLYINNVAFSPNEDDIITTTSFSASNNVSNQNIPALLFSSNTWGFDIYMSIKLLSDSNLFSNYHIRGVNKDSSWEIIQQYVGDSIVTFNITTLGQLQYSTPNYSNFVSLTFKFKVITN